MAKKAANYTPEMETKMVELYTAGREAGEENKPLLETIGKEIGKSPASVRAKLATLGNYEKDEPDTPTGTRVKKADLVAGIKNAGVSLNEADMEGLEKATAGALTKILATLTNK